MCVLDLIPKARETKAKITKQDYNKLKSFCTVRETINKAKRRQPVELEKIFANDLSHKGLNIQTIYRTPTTQQQKNPNNPN